MIFGKDYAFKGAHADKVRALADSKFDKVHKLFDRYMDVYLLAPIVGFLMGRRSPVDKTSTKPANILASIINDYRNDLLFSYRLIMLLDDSYEPNQEERINKAFRYYGDDEKTKPDLERFDEYVRGGVDYLYEVIFKDAVEPDDYINNIHDFVEDFQNKYGSLSEEILQLCKTEN